MSKVGLGVVTYNRQKFLEQVVQSIKKHNQYLSEIVIVNDGTPYQEDVYGNFEVIQHQINKGVGAAKNTAITALLNKGCQYIFLIEDDILLTDSEVFERYVKLHETSRIHHFNFAFHGPANKNGEKKKIKAEVHFKKSDIYMHLVHHCIGAFSFYTKECIERVGLIDEHFVNAWEHVDHTYRIIRNKMHPPFWWFCDIKDSDLYLQEIESSEKDSVIRPRPDWQKNIQIGALRFYEKHGFVPVKIPEATHEQALRATAEIVLCKT